MRIEDETVRHTALKSVSDVIEPVRARDVIAGRLRHVRWTEMLDPVLRFQPDAVVAALDEMELLRGTAHEPTFTIAGPGE